MGVGEGEWGGHEFLSISLESKSNQGIEGGMEAEAGGQFYVYVASIITITLKYM